MYDAVCQQHMNSYAKGLSQVYSRLQRPAACMCEYTRSCFRMAAARMTLLDSMDSKGLLLES